MAVELAHAIRANQYGVRTPVRSGASVIKLEVVLEARIELSTPKGDDKICGLSTLAPVDLAAEKLLANADRWADDAVFSRDVIDLAMHAASPLLRAACAKAETAYGDAVRHSLTQAIDALRERGHRLEACMNALDMTPVSKAALWQAMRRLARVLPPPQEARGKAGKAGR